MVASYVIRDTSDDAISMVAFGLTTDGAATAAQTIRIYNDGDATPAELLLAALTSNGNFAGDRNNQGQEAVTEKWLEASTDGGSTWTAIGGDPLTPANVLSLTPPAAGAYIDVQLRLNMPATPTTSGNFAVIPCLFWPVET